MEFPDKTPADDDFKDLALRMALHCVRNTVIENYHTNGGISDLEMMAFNKEVVNKLYSFLQLYFNPAYRDVCRAAFKTPVCFTSHMDGTPRCLMPVFAGRLNSQTNL